MGTHRGDTMTTKAGTMDRISVVIPAYNAEAFIEETVDSALAQTHPDVEVVVVDDGSTDGTLDRLARFGHRIIVHRQSNAGVSAARNAGVLRATGAWIAFLDADDVWLPNKLEWQLSAADTPLVYTNRYNIGARGDVPEIQSDITRMHDGDVFLPLLLEGNFITMSSVMMRRDLYQQVGGFFEGLAAAADWDFWVRVAERHPVRCCHEPLMRYRFHPAGMSRNDRKMRRERELVISRALALERGRALDWTMKRRIWSSAWMTTAWDAGCAGARARALADCGRAAIAWPLSLQIYKEALKLCLP
jgi:glycosyltransferase involved in cell wall biosynthesis